MVFLGNRYELKFRSGTPSVGDSFPPNNLAMAFGLVTGLICYIEFIKLTNRQFEETKLPVRDYTDEFKVCFDDVITFHVVELFFKLSE